MLLDDILPEYQISAAYSIDINAPADKVYREALNPRFMDSFVFRTLMRIREMPSKLFGKGERFFNEEVIGLNELKDSSVFTILGREENKEVVFGIIGRFWDVIHTDPRNISNLEEFNAFNKPEYGKAVMNFHLEPTGDITKLHTETRVHFSDEKYLKRFMIYWFIISYFSGVTRNIFLRKIKSAAERTC